MNNISFIGLGNMGSSILRAVADTKENISIGIFDLDTNVVNSIKEELSSNNVIINDYNSLQGLIGNSNIVVLCVKPQVLAKIYKDIADANINNTLFISIAAGIKTSTLSKNLNSDRVVRFMPNLAAECKKSVTAVCAYKNTSEKDKKTAFTIAETFGSAFFLEEDKFSAFIGISGSAIAFILEFAHALALGGTHQGIPYNTALDIAFSTMESAKSLYEEDKENPISLVSKVCSAGGTTIEGIKTLKDHGFSSAVINSVINTAKKSKELEEK